MSVTSLPNSQRAIQQFLVIAIPADTYPAFRSKLLPIFS